MKKSTAAEPWREPILGACACSQLRRTARAVSALYDEYLAPVSLTVTQYALLVSIARADGLVRTELAATLGMERTTLTRNLRPLERDGLVGEKPGTDRRTQLLYLTAAGRRRLDKSYPLWEEAQRAFFREFGPDKFDTIRSLLSDAAEASKSARESRPETKKAGRRAP